MSQERTGAYGCPACGHDTFHTQQSVTRWGYEDITCKFEATTEGFAEFETIDYGETSLDDGESGDISDTKTCAKCAHEYTSAAFSPDKSVAECVRDLLGEFAQPILSKVAFPGDVCLERALHATVITITPSIQQHRRWLMELCCR